MERFDTAEDAEFRVEARRFFAENLPSDIKRHCLAGLPMPRALQDEWHNVLLAKGWGAPTWPVEHGGTGWPLKRQYIFEQERSRAWSPPSIDFNFNMVGPLLIRFGSTEQKRRWLPPCLLGEHHWCQGFSEPGAGSDLASLQCRAERRGDRFIISGSKTWQTSAFETDMMFGLFRTSQTGARKQDGISLIMLPMTSPGLTVTPIRLMDGEERVGGCTFDEVETPEENLLGEEGQGWALAKFLLVLERLCIADVAPSRASLRRLKSLVCSRGPDGRLLVDDPHLAADLATVEGELRALEATEYGYLFDPKSYGELGAESSILKMQGSVIHQRIAELIMRVAGPLALTTERTLPHQHISQGGFAPWATRHYLNARKLSIYGGSNEIQRNIAARAVLGL